MCLTESNHALLSCATASERRLDTPSNLTDFFYNSTAHVDDAAFSLHDALPISTTGLSAAPLQSGVSTTGTGGCPGYGFRGRDRKSTRLNSSHVAISYAVFCLKKKKRYRKDLGFK